MDFDFTSEQEAFRETVRAFAERELAPASAIARSMASWICR